MSEVQQDNGGISDHHKTQIEIAATEPEKLSGCAWRKLKKFLTLFLQVPQRFLATLQF